MKFIHIANTFCIGVENNRECKAIVNILDEYNHMIMPESKGVPSVGILTVEKKLCLPLGAVELRKGILYEYEKSLFIHFGNTTIRVDCEEASFKMCINIDADDAVTFFTFEMLIRFYAPQYGLVFMHTGAFVYHGNVCVLNAFGGVGKTEVMLKALEHGATFLSDDFAIFDSSGRIFPYTKKIYLCEYPYDDFMLKRVSKSKMLYLLKCWCEHINGPITKRIAQRLESRYFGIKIDYTTITQNETPDRFYSVDSFYWVDNSDATREKDISPDYFISRMRLCLDIESRRYFDYDGYFRLKWPFLNENKWQQSEIIKVITNHVKVKGLTINHKDFAGLADLVMKINE